MTTKPARPPVDWEAIEREYRLGKYSVRELAKRHSITHPPIIRRAAKEGWTQDKAPEVNRRVAERLLLAGPSRPSGTAGTAGTPTEGTAEGTGEYHEKTRAKPRVEITSEDIDAAVEEKLSIHVAHRNMGRDFRGILMGLGEELRRTTAELHEIEEDIEVATMADQDGSRRARMMRAISLPSRVTSAASLISSAKNIQWIERLANNMPPGLPQDTGTADSGPWQIVQFGDIVEAPE